MLVRNAILKVWSCLRKKARVPNSRMGILKSNRHTSRYVHTGLDRLQQCHNRWPFLFLFLYNIFVLAIFYVSLSSRLPPTPPRALPPPPATLKFQAWLGLALTLLCIECHGLACRFFRVTLHLPDREEEGAYVDTTRAVADPSSLPHPISGNFMGIWIWGCVCDQGPSLHVKERSHHKQKQDAPDRDNCTTCRTLQREYKGIRIFVVESEQGRRGTFLRLW